LILFAVKASGFDIPDKHGVKKRKGGPAILAAQPDGLVNFA
jgi:hypothetical protein